MKFIKEFQEQNCKIFGDSMKSLPDSSEIGTCFYFLCPQISFIEFSANMLVVLILHIL